MGRLGIIAASGNLPLQLAEAAQSQGEAPFIICLNAVTRRGAIYYLSERSD